MPISYTPPGPVSEAFHADSSFVRGIKGPVGSGKSSSSCFEVFSRALEQLPGPDGVRRSRSIITRNTYPELKSTTIKTWQDWFQDVCVMKFDTPITGTIEISDIGDGTGLWHEAIFLALDRPDDLGKLRSLEATFAWMNEASEQEKQVLDMLTQRVGRFPAKRNGGPTWTGIIMDTNPPDDDHWWYQLAEVDRPEDYKFFDQPGGLIKIMDAKDPRFNQWVPNPLAENVENLPGGYQYYLRQLAGKSEDYIKVFLGGMYGTTMDGKPVYPEYNDKVHVATSSLLPIQGRPILLAFDFGLTPACAFLQMNTRGQVMVLAELVSEGMGIRQFYSNVVLPFKNSRYSGFRIEAVGDPAGNMRSQTNEKTCMEELLDMGLLCEPAGSNEFIKRRESVAFFLTQLAGGEPAFLIDPSCKMTRKGFNGGYRYERLKTSGPAKFKDRPVKDKYSHIHDALQYGCMQLRGDMNPVRAHQVVQASMGGWT
jgi:hypothetical protein